MFKTLTGLLDPKKTLNTEEVKKIPSWLLCRWLSGNPNTLKMANVFNVYSGIPVECQAKMVRDTFAGKVKYIPYPKQTKHQDEKSVEYVAEYFKISLPKAREYIEVMSEDELKNIVQMFENQ